MFRFIKLVAGRKIRHILANRTEFTQALQKSRKGPIHSFIWLGDVHEYPTHPKMKVDLYSTLPHSMLVVPETFPYYQISNVLSGSVRLKCYEEDASGETWQKFAYENDSIWEFSQNVKLTLSAFSDVSHAKRFGVSTKQAVVIEPSKKMQTTALTLMRALDRPPTPLLYVPRTYNREQMLAFLNQNRSQQFDEMTFRQLLHEIHQKCL